MDELTRLAKLAVEHQRREDAKLAAMTEDERRVYIRAWAERVASESPDPATEYDRWANGHST